MKLDVYILCFQTTGKEETILRKYITDKTVLSRIEFHVCDLSVRDPELVKPFAIITFGYIASHYGTATPTLSLPSIRYLQSDEELQAKTKQKLTEFSKKFVEMVEEVPEIEIDIPTTKPLTRYKKEELLALAAAKPGTTFVINLPNGGTLEVGEERGDISLGELVTISLITDTLNPKDIKIERRHNAKEEEGRDNQ